MTNPLPPDKPSEPTWPISPPGQPPPVVAPYYPSMQDPPPLDQQRDNPYGQVGAPQPYEPQPSYEYGYGQPGYGQPVYVNPNPTNGLAIASLVCSLAGLLTFISAPVGAILGHVARRQIKESGGQGDGMALAGIIVGWCVTGLYLCGCGIYLVLIFGVISSAGVSTGT